MVLANVLAGQESRSVRCIDCHHHPGVMHLSMTDRTNAGTACEDVAFAAVTDSSSHASVIGNLLLRVVVFTLIPVN